MATGGSKVLIHRQNWSKRPQFVATSVAVETSVLALPLAQLGGRAAGMDVH